MTTLHVLPDGTIKGLYTEALDLNTLGLLEVKRALAIEFDNPVLCKYSDAVRVFGFRRFPSSTDLVSAKLD